MYQLNSFDLCLEKLQTLAESYPDNEAVKPEMHRVKARLEELQTGQYSFFKMYKQAKSSPPLIDCATFSKAVEIRPSPGRGRGLFTNGPIAAGELILCEKAFAYCYAGDDQPSTATRMLMNLATKRMVVGGQAGLLTQIVQKLHHCPQLSPLFEDLYCADYPRVAVSQADGVPVVDT